MEPTTIATTIQELSSGVIGIGEFSPSNIGSVGDVHPNAVAADKSISVAKFEKIITISFSNVVVSITYFYIIREFGFQNS